MKEHPILFNGPMVRAILEGRKTQTRRIVKPQPHDHKDGSISFTRSHGAWLRCREDQFLDFFDHESPCHVGSSLWVRETWAPGWTYGGSNQVVFYQATGDGYIGSESYPVLDVQNGKYGLTACGADASAPKGLKWRPSIHMPRWASRITLEVTGVRVERLRDISEADAEAEGTERMHEDHLGQTFKTYRRGFESLWQSIYAKRPGQSWDDNPWVWVTEFRRVKS